MKILLLTGGDSSEREVSLSSGKAIFDSLKRLNHEVLVIDPSTGKSLIGSDGSFSKIIEPVEPVESVEPTDGMVKGDTSALLAALLREEHASVEVVFIALHGGAGEDGTIQGVLDNSGHCYTGSGMVASAVTMDKAKSKKLFSSENLLTPQWELYELTDSDEKHKMIASDIVCQFDFPLIIKPNNGGSTVALTKVVDEKSLLPAIELVAGESRELLAEAFIDGKELTVAVLAGHAFPVVEIKPKSGLYDYEAKYTVGKTEYIAPAAISDELSDKIRSVAVEAYRVTGVSGLARVDFISVDNERFYILELNSQPGMTKLSLVPMAAACEDISFDQLVTMIIDDAMKKLG